VVNLVSPCFFSFINISTFATYFFIFPICKAIIISLEPCALNVELQHFIPKFNKISLLYGCPQIRVWGERRPKDKVTLQIILIFTLTLTHPKTFTYGCVSVFDKYLHWPYVSVSVNHLHLH
jgi:hypothetical protein